MVCYQAKNFEDLVKRGFYYQFTSGAVLSPREHRHDFYELVYVCEGEALHCIDGQDSRLAAGCFTVLSPKEAHFFRWRRPGTDLFSLSVTAERFERMTKALGETPRFGTVQRAENSVLVEDIARLESEPEEGLPRLLALILGDFLSESLRRENVGQPGVPVGLSTALAQMYRPENARGGTQRLRELAGYSRSQLCRLTRRYYGRTPQQLTDQCRMSVARRLIETTERPLLEIAETLGYASLSHFYTTVKRFYGQTPGALRRKARPEGYAAYPGEPME